MQESDSRRSNTRGTDVEIELARANRDLLQAAAAIYAWRKLVEVMVYEQRQCDSGERWTRDLTDVQNVDGRARYVRTRTEEYHRRKFKAQGGM